MCFVGGSEYMLGVHKSDILTKISKCESFCLKAKLFANWIYTWATKKKLLRSKGLWNNPHITGQYFIPYITQPHKQGPFLLVAQLMISTWFKNMDVKLDFSPGIENTWMSRVQEVIGSMVIGGLWLTYL